MFSAILRHRLQPVKRWSQVSSKYNQSHHAVWRIVCGTTEQASAAVTFRTYTEAAACPNADLTHSAAIFLSFRVITLKQNLQMEAMTSPVRLLLRGDQVDIISYEALPDTNHSGAPLWHKPGRTEIRFPFDILDLRIKLTEN